jgi:hypothetical protein
MNNVGCLGHSLNALREAVLHSFDQNGWDGLVSRADSDTVHLHTKISLQILSSSQQQQHT